MTLPLPKPQYYGYLFSDDQMREYGQQCREAALEEAALIVEADLYPDTKRNYQMQYNEGIVHKAAQIRSLK